MSNVKIISQGQLRCIANKVSERFTLVNMGTYYIVTDNNTNESTSYTYDSNFIFLLFCKTIRYEYLLMVREPIQYFNWRIIGFEIAGEREQYLNKIILKIVELSCGWKIKK
jgi:hypothetical protein